MNFERIQKLAEKVMAGLHEAEIGELIFMHHVIMQTISMLKDCDEPDTLQICDTIEQAIFNEISRRVASGKISFIDPDALQAQIIEYYENSPRNSELAKELKNDLMESYMDTAKRGKKKKSGMEKENRAFLKRYEEAFNLKRKKMKIPSPNEIINGKSPSDIPNN